MKKNYDQLLKWLVKAVVRGGAGAPEFGVSKKRTALWEENRGTTNYLSMDGDFFLGILSFFS